MLADEILNPCLVLKISSSLTNPADVSNLNISTTE